MIKIIHELELKNEELSLTLSNEKESALKYIELYDLSPAGYFSLTHEGKIIEINLSGAEMLGNDPRLLKGTYLSSCLSAESKIVFDTFLAKAFTSGSKELCEISLSITGKTPVYVVLTGIVPKNSKECLVIMVDTTERKKAKEELRIKLDELILANKELMVTEQALKENGTKLLQLNDDKDRFISILGHDLRSPFSGLLGLSDLLIENIRKLDRDEIEVFANYINSSAKNTYNLLDNLLIWGRSQANRIPFDPKKLSLKHICKDVLDILNPNAISKNISVDYSGVTDIDVYADINMLKTILRNLVSNAIKFTKKNGAIKISALKEDSNIVISVSDNGIGIPPGIYKQLFDISKIHTTQGTADEEGTGLGLIICKEFVEKHRGKIGVESTVGIGSRFYFTLPSPVEIDPVKTNTGSDLNVKDKISDLNILITDDDESSRMLLTIMVDMYGKNIIYAKTGVEAVEACHKNPDIDLILMDIQMPEMNGYEATTKIRQFNQEVVIIIQTAFDLSNEKALAKEAGCNDFISKPINRALLNEMIKKHFKR
jgi:PAS domain S-box-containing protein